MVHCSCAAHPFVIRLAIFIIIMVLVQSSSSCSWLLSSCCCCSSSMAATDDTSCSKPVSCPADSTTSNVILRNSALVFVKPSANTPATQALVRETLQKAGCTIVSEKTISGDVIDQKKLIDQHYYAIASKATLLAPQDIPVPADLFHRSFQESWETVLREDRTCNALEACRRFGCTATQLDEAWQKSSVVKLGGGFYCGRITINDTSLYVFNAFFMQMRSKFVHKEASVHCFDIEWDGAVLSWQDFRGKVLGPTDPAAAPPGSLRRIIFDTYQDLGLSDVPNKGDNGVHGSASPLEGLGEKMNWLQRPIHKDSFGQALLAEGIPADLIKQWTLDPQVKLTQDDGSTRGSIFDALEGLDAPACLAKLKALSALA